MLDQILQLSEKIEGVEKLCNQTFEHVTNSINLYWAVVAGVLSIAGIALFFVAKSLVESGIKKGTESLRAKFEEQNQLCAKAIAIVRPPELIFSGSTIKGSTILMAKEISEFNTLIFDIQTTFLKGEFYNSYSYSDCDLKPFCSKDLILSFSIVNSNLNNDICTLSIFDSIRFTFTELPSGCSVKRIWGAWR